MAELKKGLGLNHNEILRMAFVGMPITEISARMGMSYSAVWSVLASPLAKAELARMKEVADEVVTNLPLRTALQDRLQGAAKDALTVNHALLLDPTVPPRTRASIGRHFLDRLVFDRTSEDEREDSYRNILRNLNDIKRSLGESSMLLPPVNGGVVESKPKEAAGNGDGEG